MATKALWFLTIVFLIVGCAVWSQPAEKQETRRPAQVEVDADLEESFLAHWNSKEASFDGYFTRLVAIFFRAHQYSLEFDKELALRLKNKKSDQDMEPMINSEA